MPAGAARPACEADTPQCWAIWAAGDRGWSGYFGGDLDPAIERSIQLDPATRTGWIYSSDGTQIQQFSY